MSFGVSVTDLKEAISLSWRLYTSLKDAPQEIKDLAKDLATVYGVLNHVQEDMEADESAILAHGEDRQKMLQSMTQGLKATLVEIQAIIDKFRPMAAGTPKPEQLWIRLKWVVGQKKLKRIRQDISFHISSFTLLMTSMGNSSLRRIEDGLADMRLTATENLEEDSRNRSDISKPERDLHTTPRAATGSETEDKCVPGIPGSMMPKCPKPIPSWLVPNENLPAQEFATKVQQLDDFGASCLGEIVFANCRAACYHFYKMNLLWRTFYGTTERPLFSTPEGYMPIEPNDIPLAGWLSKMHHLFSVKLNEPDSVTASTVYDWPEYSLASHSFLMIPSIRDPWDRVDIDQFEDGLVSAIQLCRHYQAWDSFGRLKGFWRDLHHWARDTDGDVSLNYEKYLQSNEWSYFSGRSRDMRISK